MAEQARQSGETRRSLRRHAVISIALIAVLIGGSAVWAATTRIAGAVVAPGVIVVESGSSLVQHPEGGVVHEVRVRDGDMVAAGDVLIRLEGTTLAANLEVVVAQLRDAFAREARLRAESTGAEQLELSALAADWRDDAELQRLLGEQEVLRQARRVSRDGQAARLSEQALQLEQQIGGLEAQRVATVRQLEIATAEEKDVAGLYERQLVGAARVNEVRSQKAQLEGRTGELVSQIAAARAAIAERQVQAEQIGQEFRSEVLAELQAATQQIAELLQRKIAAEDRLQHLEIRAPISGVVHESTIDTAGGVVRPGDTLMRIVPQNARLTVDAQVSPFEIDRLRIGQPVVLRLSSLDVRVIPDLAGSIAAISPDLSSDPRTGASYFAVRVQVQPAELGKLPADLALVPGMPTEVFAQTGDRTVWSYLVHPLTIQMERAFREE